MMETKVKFLCGIGVGVLNFKEKMWFFLKKGIGLRSIFTLGFGFVVLGRRFRGSVVC